MAVAAAAAAAVAAAVAAEGEGGGAWVRWIDLIGSRVINVNENDCSCHDDAMRRDRQLRGWGARARQCSLVAVMQMMCQSCMQMREYRGVVFRVATVRACLRRRPAAAVLAAGAELGAEPEAGRPAEEAEPEVEPAGPAPPAAAADVPAGLKVAPP